MTEADWLACGSFEKLLEFISSQPSKRKFRLFVCACCRANWQILSDERQRLAVETSERFADGVVTREELEQARILAWRSRGETRESRFKGAMCTWAARDEMNAGFALLIVQAECLIPEAREESHCCDLLRDIFGNPFHPLPARPY